MKAVVLDTDNRFTLTSLDEPVPAAGEVAVRVEYAGIQWGDVLVRGGYFPVPRPFVPGFEAAGRVVAVGEGVDPARVGQLVTALTSSGAYAETVVAPAVLALPVGDLDTRTAAAFGWAGPTAWDLIHTVTRVRPGETVLVHAALGGVGSLAAQFASAAGAGRIVGVVGDPDQADYAAKLGYDRLVSRHGFPETLGDERFDVILDPVGGPVRAAGLDRLAPHGRLVVYGAMGGAASVLIDADDLLAQGRSVLTYNSHLLSRTAPERLAASAVEALRLLSDGRARIDVAAVYEPADLDAAVQRLAAGGTRGKHLVRFGG
ncbi:zinc-binding alcohol dehydrogenase family protein [Streptomyces sp. NPDC058745]|uniref:quinone oxidoreductase family protein n=1 Tax=Streptomyces sp. NPDC058745 TaxID=3346621 RepID=UPI00369999EE